jgi:hypothetical protein
MPKARLTPTATGVRGVPRLRNAKGKAYANDNRGERKVQLGGSQRRVPAANPNQVCSKPPKIFVVMGEIVKSSRLKVSDKKDAESMLVRCNESNDGEDRR